MELFLIVLLPELADAVIWDARASLVIKSRVDSILLGGRCTHCRAWVGCGEVERSSPVVRHERLGEQGELCCAMCLVGNLIYSSNWNCQSLDYILLLSMIDQTGSI
jgi:hypothetical protein